MTAFRYKFDTLINSAGVAAVVWPIFCYFLHVGRLSWALVVLTTCETWQNVRWQRQNIKID